jgi:hypothetical protein
MIARFGRFRRSMRTAPRRDLSHALNRLALMPAYAKNLLPSSVVSRPLEGEAPTIDLAVGYSKANTSPILKLFLSRMDELIGFATPRLHVPSGTGKRARTKGRAGA